MKIDITNKEVKDLKSLIKFVEDGIVIVERGKAYIVDIRESKITNKKRFDADNDMTKIGDGLAAASDEIVATLGIG